MRLFFSSACVLALAAALGGASCALKTAASADAPAPAVIAAPLVAPAKTSASEGAAHAQRLKQQDAELVAGLKGQLRRVPMPYSPNLKRALTAWVYLPPNYDQATTRYPVAYILHGAPGGVRDCFVNAGVHRVAEQLIETGKIAPLILVGWDGGGPGGLDDVTYYLNRRDGYDMENFTLRELVPWVDAHFRTRADARSRALIGFSAGGFGAANLGLNHPDVWRVIASHSGFFDPHDDPHLMTEILGPPSLKWEENDPLLLVRALPENADLYFYLDVGRDDELLGEFKKMRAELRARDVDFESHIFPGDHSWEYLHAHYFDSLRFADQSWKEMARP